MVYFVHLPVCAVLYGSVVAAMKKPKQYGKVFFSTLLDDSTAIIYKNNIYRTIGPVLEKNENNNNIILAKLCDNP